MSKQRVCYSGLVYLREEPVGVKAVGDKPVSINGHPLSGILPAVLAKPFHLAAEILTWHSPDGRQGRLCLSRHHGTYPDCTLLHRRILNPKLLQVRLVLRRIEVIFRSSGRNASCLSLFN